MDGWLVDAEKNWGTGAPVFLKLSLKTPKDARAELVVGRLNTKPVIVRAYDEMNLPPEPGYYD